MSEDNKPKYGELTLHLLKSKRISLEQLQYAERILSKLPTPKPLVHILKDLKVITDETVDEVIRETRLSIRIGELLVELGHLTPQDLDSASNMQKESEKDLKLGEILHKYNFIESQVFNRILSIQLGYPITSVSLSYVDKKVLARVPLPIITKHQFLPLITEGNSP